MEKQEALVAKLLLSINAYKDAIAAKVGEEQEDLLRVAGQAETVARALEANDAATVKLSLYAVSRQVSDSYYPQPPEFKELSLSLGAIKKYIFGGT